MNCWGNFDNPRVDIKYVFPSCVSRVVYIRDLSLGIIILGCSGYGFQDSCYLIYSFIRNTIY